MGESRVTWAESKVTWARDKGITQSYYSCNVASISVGDLLGVLL